MVLPIVALFFAGVSLGMNIWSLSIAMKHLAWKDSKGTGNRSDNSGNER